jgi:hypothetical protein
MNSSLIPLFGVGLLTGLIPASIAGRKGYNFLQWWVFGAALLIIALPCALFLPNKAPRPLESPKKEASPEHRIVAGTVCSLSYVAVGFGVLLVGEIPFIVMSSNNPDGARGADPLSAMLCFVSGLALFSYARWQKNNAPSIKANKEIQKHQRTTIETEVRHKYEKELADKNDYWAQRRIEEKIEKEISERLKHEATDKNTEIQHDVA